MAIIERKENGKLFFNHREYTARIHDLMLHAETKKEAEFIAEQIVQSSEVTTEEIIAEVWGDDENEGGRS
jgi:hypothetical protein